MAPIIHVTDPADPRLADYVRMRDVSLRKSLEAERGLFLAEGEKVIRRAAAAGYPPRSFFMAERWLASLDDVLGPCDVPVYLAGDALAEAVAGFPIHRGAMASFERLPLPPVPDLVRDARRILVLEDLADHANVGAIFRCAAALGIDAVVVSPRCADPLYRRAVKVSMGAVFSVPYARMTRWHDGLAELRQAGFRLLALTPATDSPAIGDIDPGDRCALLLGTEGDGLSSRWLDAADAAVRIPMDAGVDSLNVVAAAAIACYVFTA